MISIVFSFSNFPANGGGGAPRPTGRQVRLPAATAVIPNNQQQQLKPAFVFNPQQQQRAPQQQLPQQAPPQDFLWHWHWQNVNSYI